MADLAFLARHPLLRRLLLPVAAVIAFAIFFVLTFPYDTLARRLEVEAQRSGAELSIGSLGPAGFLGVRARDVKLRLAAGPGDSASPEIHLDRADVRPDLFALILRRTSFGFSVEGYGGSARGHVALSNDARQPGVSSLRLDAHDIDLSTLPLKELSGVEATGKLQLKADLPTLLPVETAGGTVSLSLDGGGVGGTILGFTLPRTSLGHVDGSATVDKGVAHLEKTNARGGDIDADIDGNLNLRPLLSLSQADLHVRFRPAEKWLDQNGMIKGMMGLIQNARQGDGSYLFTFSGPLLRMQPRPGR
jgi:type II secretion system protein N